MENTEALRNLAVKVTGKSAEEITGDTNAELIQFISDNYSGGGSSSEDKEVIELLNENNQKQRLTIYGGSLCVMEMSMVGVADLKPAPNRYFGAFTVVRGMCTVYDSGAGVEQKKYPGYVTFGKKESGDNGYAAVEDGTSSSVTKKSCYVSGTVVWTI